MTSPRRWLRNFILPLAILAPLLFLMVGCIYVPWFEQRQISTQVDFRPMLGDARSSRRIRPGSINRAAIETILGKPPYLSEDGLAIGYELRTHSSYWVYPLCFGADPADVKAYIVKFTFDSHGVLARYDVASNDEPLEWIAYSNNNLTVGQAAFRKLSASGPKLRIAAFVLSQHPTTAATQP